MLTTNPLNAKEPIYADMLDGKHKGFPSKHLAANGNTLGKLLQQIQQGPAKKV